MLLLPVSGIIDVSGVVFFDVDKSSSSDWTSSSTASSVFSLDGLTFFRVFFRSFPFESELDPIDLLLRLIKSFVLPSLQSKNTQDSTHLRARYNTRMSNSSVKKLVRQTLNLYLLKDIVLAILQLVT